MTEEPRRAITRAESRAVNRWRGLSADVLLALTRLDQQAIGWNDRFSEQRKLLIEERKLCRALRKEFNLHPFDRLAWTKEEKQDGV